MYAENYRWGPHSATDNEFEARQYRRLLTPDKPVSIAARIGVHRPSDIIYMALSILSVIALTAQFYILFAIAYRAW